MKHTLIILALLCASCLATSGEIDRAIAEITGDIAAVARSGEESAEAAREAYRQGQITYTELQARLRDVTVASLDAGEKIAKDVLEGVKKTIEKRPEEVVTGVGQAVGGALPGTPGEIVLWGSSLVATYLAARRAAAERAAQQKALADAQRKAEDTAWDIEHERVKQLAMAAAGGKTK